MAQTHTHVDYMDYGNLDLDDIMNIGTKGYFKPIPDDSGDSGNDGENDDDFCCIDPIEQLDNELVAKVGCPYEDPETGMLPPNCKYNDCRECPKCVNSSDTAYGAAKSKQTTKKTSAKKTSTKKAAAKKSATKKTTSSRTKKSSSK